MTRDPCWLVVVRHPRNSGVEGQFVSKPLSYTQARRLLDFYRATGHRVRLREVRRARKAKVA